MKKVSLVIVGAGGRGGVYAKYAEAFPEDAEVVAVCEPRPQWRERMARAHSWDSISSKRRRLATPVRPSVCDSLDST